MPTFAQLKTKIQNKTELNFNATQVGDALNDSIQYYSSKEFWFNEDQATLTCTAGSAILTTGLPSDFYGLREPNGLVISDGQSTFPLQKVTGLQYDTMDSQSQGRPQFYLYRDRKIYLYPYPDSAYTVFMNYTKSYSALVNDSDTNDFTDYADRLIEAEAISSLYRDFRHSPQDAAIYEKVARKEMNQIIQQTTSRLSTGFLTTQNIVDGGDRGPGNRWYRYNW